MTDPSFVPPRNTMALASLILGIIGCVLGVVVIGALLGGVGLVLGLLALKRPDRRGLAIVGIITGGLSIPVALVALMLGAVLIPAIGAARAAAKDAVAMSNMHQLINGVLQYGNDYGDWPPPSLAYVGRYVGNNPQTLLDTRLNTAPLALPPGSDWSDHAAEVDAHCDFYYAGAGVNLMKVKRPSDFILLYDHRGAGRSRIIAFGDGHVESYRPGSADLRDVVARNNQVRGSLKVPALPVELDGPPPGISGGSGMTAENP